MNIGTNLRRLREAQELSRPALALKSGVSAATIARTELYGHQPKLDAVVALAAALDVPVTDLLEPTEAVS